MVLFPKTKFDERMISDLKRLKINEDFMSDFYDLRDKWLNYDFDEDNNFFSVDRLINNNKDISNFNDDIIKLRNKHKLGVSYHVLISSWILSGESKNYEIFNIYDDEEGESIYIWRALWGTSDLHGEEILHVNIYPETTFKDLAEMWPIIKQEKTSLYKKNTKRILPRRNIDRDTEIATLKKQGKKASEITRIINKKYPNKKITYEYVSRIIKRLKK